MSEHQMVVCMHRFMNTEINISSQVPKYLVWEMDVEAEILNGVEARNFKTQSSLVEDTKPRLYHEPWAPLHGGGCYAMLCDWQDNKGGIAMHYKDTSFIFGSKPLDTTTLCSLLASVNMMLHMNLQWFRCPTFLHNKWCTETCTW